MEDQIKFYQAKLKYEVDSWDLYEKMQSEEVVIVIDTRSKEAYEVEHIPGAISIPHRTMNDETTMTLNKEVLYVTYCDGIGCNASTKGALNMTKLGFCVKELLGGLDWWKRDGYKTEAKISARGKEKTCGC